MRVCGCVRVLVGVCYQCFHSMCHFILPVLLSSGLCVHFICSIFRLSFTFTRLFYVLTMKIKFCFFCVCVHQTVLREWYLVIAFCHVFILFFLANTFKKYLLKNKSMLSRLYNMNANVLLLYPFIYTTIIYICRNCCFVFLCSTFEIYYDESNGKNTILIHHRYTVIDLKNTQKSKNNCIIYHGRNNEGIQLRCG